MTKRNISVVLCVVLLFSCILISLPARAVNTTFDITATYTEKTEFNGKSVSSYDGLVSSSTAVTMNTTYNGQKSVKIVPKQSDAPIMTDHSSCKDLELSLVNIKYISFYCYYSGTASLDRAELIIMDSYKSGLASPVTAKSIQQIKKGQWQWLTFDIGSATFGKIGDNANLQQFRFLPYGSINSNQLKTADVAYISQIRYVSSDKAKDSGIAGVPISFTASRPDVAGNDPDTIYASVGAEITLPGNPYTRENYVFDGWICSADGKKYAADSKYTVKERTRVSDGISISNITAEAIFYPDWKSTDNQLPDVITVEYSDYFGGKVNLDDNQFEYEKNFEFLGRNTVKIAVNPNAADLFRLDSFIWDEMPLDLDKYKYMAVTYYCKTDNDLSFVSEVVLRTKGGALSSQIALENQFPSVTNQWGVMGFDLSQAEQNFSNSDSHILNQLHFYIGGDDVLPKDFNQGDAFYIDSFTFYSEKPQNLTVTKPVISGDGNGNVRPNDSLTRAEAAQIVYNIIQREGIMEIPSIISEGFSDVIPGDWFYTSVATLDTLGVLSKEEKFRPDDNITAGELLLLLTNINLGGTDSVAFGYSNSRYITRAEAVSLICDILDSQSPEKFRSLKLQIFNDLDTESWEYVPMLNLSAVRLSSFDSQGNETIYHMLCPGSNNTSLDCAIGDTGIYIKELDRYEKARIQEIRNTESEYSTRTNGTIYYLSSSTGTALGGDSEQSPRLITNLSEISSLSLKNGDIVLFKRGDIFRGSFTCIPGVTYSAYGSGEKPKLYRSEKNYTDSSNWEIYSSDSSGKIIWQSTEKITNDVGGIIINDGEVVGLKEIPSYVGGKYYVRGEEDTTLFNIDTELDRNHEFFHDIDGRAEGSGYLYFRCDEGNPGELYESIELNQRGNLITAKTNVTIDNLCLKYFGSHGIGAGTVANLTVTNCEIGWGGGSIQSFSDGKVVRYGNGVEIYGAVVNFLVDNCYIYQIYDAGVTHQISSASNGNYYMENVVYSNNVICDSTYNIEYFMSKDNSNDASERFMKDVLFENNLLRRAGYGWGSQRHASAPASIKGWEHRNNAVNMVIRNNIIDRCYNVTGGESRLLDMGTRYNGSTAYLDGNTFIQVAGRDFARNHENKYEYDSNVEEYIGYIGGRNNTVMYAPEDYGK